MERIDPITKDFKCGDVIVYTTYNGSLFIAIYAYQDKLNIHEKISYIVESKNRPYYPFFKKSEMAKCCIKEIRYARRDEIRSFIKILEEEACGCKFFVEELEELI